MNRLLITIAVAIAAPMAGAWLLKATPSTAPAHDEKDGALERITTAADRVATYRDRMVSNTSTILNHNKITETKWWVPAQIALSPDGTHIAYIREINGKTEAVIRSFARGAANSRRIPSANVVALSWNGGDNSLCLTERHGKSFRLSIVDAISGVKTTQLTDGNVNDIGGTVSADGRTVFFHRDDGMSGYNLWRYDTRTGRSSMIAPGMTICLVKGSPDEAYCARVNNRNESEIWRVNLATGAVEPVLARQGQSFTTPQVSPDGAWLLVTANSLSGKNNTPNTDIYAVRADGTQLTRLTYHPGNDLSAIWSHDGRSIYFLSQRGSKTGKYDIWRMDFNL